jgi:hypothetical protein
MSLSDILFLLSLHKGDTRRLTGRAGGRGVRNHVSGTVESTNTHRFQAHHLVKRVAYNYGRIACFSSDQCLDEGAGRRGCNDDDGRRLTTCRKRWTAG